MGRVQPEAQQSATDIMHDRGKRVWASRASRRFFGVWKTVPAGLWCSEFRFSNLAIRIAGLLFYLFFSQFWSIRVHDWSSIIVTGWLLLINSAKAVPVRMRLICRAGVCAFARTPGPGGPRPTPGALGAGPPARRPRFASQQLDLGASAHIQGNEGTEIWRQKKTRKSRKILGQVKRSQSRYGLTPAGLYGDNVLVSDRVCYGSRRTRRRKKDNGFNATELMRYSSTSCTLAIWTDGWQST